MPEKKNNSQPNRKQLLVQLRRFKAVCYRDSHAPLLVGDTWIQDNGKYYHVVGLAYPEALGHEFCDHVVIPAEVKHEKKRICCNSDCGWIGNEIDCLDWKHPTGAKLCPECHEVTEELNDPDK